MQWKDIFQAYYSLFRGQATSIPAYGNREFTWAVVAGNVSIGKWDRVDGELWRELITTAKTQNLEEIVGDTLTVAGQTTYAAMADMRKPPAFVRFYKNGTYNDVPTIPPQDAMNYSDLSGAIWFSGSANRGYTMNIGSGFSTMYGGYNIDYVYVRKPITLPLGQDCSAYMVDMSDPNFIVQDLLAARASNARNGFVFKTARKDADDALMNMKIEDGSGVYGNSSHMPLDMGWGANTDGSISL